MPYSTHDAEMVSRVQICVQGPPNKLPMLPATSGLLKTLGNADRDSPVLHGVLSSGTLVTQSFLKYNLKACFYLRVVLVLFWVHVCQTESKSKITHGLTKPEANQPTEFLHISLARLGVPLPLHRTPELHSMLSNGHFRWMVVCNCRCWLFF